MKSVRIKWGPIQCECDSCICSTEVSFREQGSSNWYTPDNPTNPTQETEYTILIEEGIYYQVRLVHRGPLCQEKEQFISLYYPLSACCPAGYELTDDASVCYKVEEINATPPSGAVDTLDEANFGSYSICGSYIYEVGWNINGTGAATQIPLTNAFWRNGSGTCVFDGNFIDGPLNRTGVWALPAQSNQDIGFSVCVDLPATKTYYIGIGCDNYAIIKVDGQTILQQNDIALAAQYGGDIAAPFKVWHIYPVTLTAGPHVIEMIGHNVDPPAGMGCEIYDATPAELIAADGYEDLGAQLIFSSKDYIGEPVQLGTQNAGYTCPEGYALAACADPIKCRKILYTNKIVC